MLNFKIPHTIYIDGMYKLLFITSSIDVQPLERRARKFFTPRQGYDQIPAKYHTRID